MGPEDFFRMLHHFIESRQDVDERDLVVVDKLTPEEELRHREIRNLCDEGKRLEKQLEAKKNRLEALRTEFWLDIEERLGVPSSMNLNLDCINNNIRMNKEDAEKVGLYHDSNVKRDR